MTTLFVFLVVLFSGNTAWAKLGESIQNRIDHSNSNSNNNKKLSSENERRNLQLSLEIIGEGGNPPPELLPLGECQGDCDTNADCGQGLICYQRRSFEAVPGCDGGADDETVSDYCIIDPSWPTAPPLPSATPSEFPSMIPTTTQRPSDAPSDVPSTAPTLQPSDLPSNVPSMLPSLQPSDQPSDIPSMVPTLGPSDFPSNVPSMLPSLQPSDQPSDIPSMAPTLGPSDAPSNVPSLTPTETSMPSDAPSDIPSNQPTGTPPSMEPTTSPRPSYEGGIQPFRAIEYVGNDGTFYSRYPLGICLGDCDTDSDCAEGLYCHQRRGNGAVPYCTGGEEEPTTADFCTWDGRRGPVPDPTPPAAPEGYFRLKLYWEKGYVWQNETFEREWCMMYNYDGYPGTGLCWYGDQNLTCAQDHVYVGKCIEDPQMWFTFVNVASPRNGLDERLIMTGDGKRCFERKDRLLLLKPCNPYSTQQRWYALNGGFNESKFEISQLGYSSQCITNDHHPKSGEVVELHDCEFSRSEESQTSFWEVF